MNNFSIAEVTTREGFARALGELRSARGVTLRELAAASDAQLATIAGWFGGKHLPTRKNSAQFLRVLEACGIDEAERQQWWDTAMAVRDNDRRPSRAPYKGLASFGADDAEWFFGRERMVDALLARAMAVSAGEETGPIVVTGSSGSGKSSLMRAGLVAGILGDDSPLPDATAVVITPSEAIPDVLPTLLVVDQAEELWSPGADPASRAAFLNRLRSIGDAPDPTVVVIGMRADFYAAALAEPVLLDALSAGPVVVGPMSTDEMRHAIVGPARQAGAAVSDELVELLLEDLMPAGAPGTGILPLLSHALLGTWERATTKTLTAADYRSTGRISGAVQQSAEEVYAALTPGEQSRAGHVLLRLVTVDGDTVTRRRMPLTELSDSDLAVLQRFADARLLTIDEGHAQVTHEALLTVWPRLRDWLDVDREWLVTHRVLTHASALWITDGRDPSALLGPSRLAYLDDQIAVGDRARDLNGTEKEFLEASRAHVDVLQSVEKRRRRVRSGLLVALAAVTVVAVVLAVTAFVARGDAVDQRLAADHARAQAESRQIVSQALAQRDRDPNVAAQLSLAAYRAQPTFEARSALLDATGTVYGPRILGTGGTIAARASTDGTLLIIGYADGTVSFRVPAADGGAPTRESSRTSVTGPVYAVAIDPSSTRAAVGGPFGIALFDVSDPTAVTPLTTQDTGGTIRSLVFSSGGTSLIAGADGGTVLRWSIASGSSPVSLPSLSLPDGGSTHVAVSPDGRFLAAAGAGRSLRLWNSTDVATAIVDRSADGSTTSYTGIEFAPGGDELAASSTERLVQRWGVDSAGRLVERAPLTGFSSYANDVAYSADGRTIAAGSSDNSIRLWERDSGALLATLPGTSIVVGLQFGGDNLMSADVSGSVRFWPTPGPVLREAGTTFFTDPSDNAGQLIIGGVGAGGTGSPVWDVTDPAAPTRFPTVMTAMDGGATSGASAISKDGTAAAVGTTAGGFSVWDVAGAQQMTRRGGVQAALASPIGVVVFDRTAATLAVSDTTGSPVQLWDVRSADPTLLSQFPVVGLPTLMAYSPSADLLAVATSESGVELWDTSTPTAPTRVSTVSGFGMSGAQAVAFSPDGSTLAAGTSDRFARLFDVTDPSRPEQLSEMRMPASIMGLAFSGSGSSVAAGLGTDSLWLWDVSDRRAPVAAAALSANGGRVNDAAFLSDSRFVAGGGRGGAIHLWHTDFDSAAAAVCATVGDPLTETEWDQYLPGVDYRLPC